MESFVLTVGAEEYRIALPSAQVVAAEKQLGGSLLEAMERIDRVSVQQILLWAGLQKYSHSMKMDKVLELIDTMCAEGCSFNGQDYDGFPLEVRAQLCTQILTVAGFFTGEAVQELTEVMAAGIGNQ